MSYFPHTRIIRVCRARIVTVYDPYGNVSDVQSLTKRPHRVDGAYRPLFWHGPRRRVRSFFNIVTDTILVAENRASNGYGPSV